jgi:hypothetical protein
MPQAIAHTARLMRKGTAFPKCQSHSSLRMRERTFSAPLVISLERP